MRIGNQIPLGEDIYSMLFASCIRHEYLYYFDKVNGKKGDISDSEEEEEEAKDKTNKEEEPFKDVQVENAAEHENLQDNVTRE